MTAYPSLARGRLYELIVSTIEEMVIGGQLKPGDPLPPERELGEQFGVSRTAVREAIKVLAEKRLVTVSQGRRATVAYPTSRGVADTLALQLRLGATTLAQLTEVRMALEPEMAALAAERATPEGIARLDAALAEHRAALADPSRAVPLDLTFHALLCDAAGNTVARGILDSIHAMLRESMMGTYRLPGVAEESLSGHERVAAAIRARDPITARREMRDHLDRVAKNLARL